LKDLTFCDLRLGHMIMDGVVAYGRLEWMRLFS